MGDRACGSGRAGCMGRVHVNRRAGVASRGPRWTARRSGSGRRPGGGGAMGGGRELAVAAVRGARG